MGGREDRKLREVAVGSYGYRHEAEFAAGFLEDAGIPYRLQVDDPALGMALSASAVLWVHAMDEDRALEILETDDAASGEGASVGVERAAPDPARRAASHRGRVSPPPARHDGGRTLAARPRALAVVSGAGLLGAAVVGALPGLAWTVPAGVLGAALVVAGVVGRAPGFVRRVLSTVSGDLP